VNEGQSFRWQNVLQQGVGECDKGTSVGFSYISGVKKIYGSKLDARFFM
jgi:hypothetical protein